VKPSQTGIINEWSAGINSGRLICFCGIHPDTDDYKRDIDFVAGLGLKGLKFHPEYQHYIVDDARMLKAYDYALGKGLALLFHAGLDDGFPGSANSTPKQFARITKELRGGTIIASHLGGYQQWDDVEKDLAGCDIYFDTSMGFEFFSRGQFLRIVEKHGADKILFGSDAPWTNAKTEAGHLRSMPLPEKDIDAILGGNAKRILALEI
jgi:predicted TIM-barrel fold metal-dependent hydrolase